MIITLLPLFLAAKFETPSVNTWKYGAEVTYLVHSHAAITHRPPSNHSDVVYDLWAKLSCQAASNSSLRCAFHDVEARSNFAEMENQRPPSHFAQEDLWTKKTLQQDSFSVEFASNAVHDVIIDADVDLAGRSMIGALVNNMNVGVNLTEKLEGDFQSSANISNRQCKTRFFITRGSSQNVQSNLIINLILLSQSAESLARSVEISRKVQDNTCPFERYSVFMHRDTRKLKSHDYEARLDAAENFMVLSQSNFTSFSKSQISVINYKDDLNYILEETTTLSLMSVGPAKEEDPASSSRENSSNDDSHKYVG